jgi:hypothetical protein
MSNLNKFKIIVIIINALNECEKCDIKSIIHFLLYAKALISFKLRIFVISRSNLSIQLSFGEIKEKYQNMILHKISPFIIKHDIAAYLENELAEIMKKYNDLVR